MTAVKSLGLVQRITTSFKPMINSVNVARSQKHSPQCLLLANRSQLFYSADPPSSLLSRPRNRPGEADHYSCHRALGAGGLSLLDIATTV